MRRLRPADWLLLASALVTGAALLSGWDGLGWAGTALVAIVVLLALLVVVALGSGARDAVNLPPGVVLVALSPFVLLVAAIATVAGDGGTAAWVGLGALALLALAAWLSMKDDRLDQPSRQVSPPPARPAPPAG